MSRQSDVVFQETHINLTAGSFSELIVLSIVIGFSIYLSLPVIFARRLKPGTMVLLTGIAVGILVFLIADIFSDVAGIIYPVGSYLADPTLTAIFFFSAGGSFLLLYILESRSKPLDGTNPMRMAMIVAVAIGFQNLTEGMVFGSAWNVGLTGLLFVILFGFIFQNFTEGFPIVSPFFGSEKRPGLYFLSLLFFVGAFPTIIGSLAGYFFTSIYLNVVFDALAIGTIFYIIIPMLLNLFKQADTQRQRSLVYAGLIGGFLIGFLVNAI